MAKWLGWFGGWWWSGMRWAGWILCTGFLAAQGGAPTLPDQRILVLTSYGDGRPGVEALLQGFRAGLERGGIGPGQVFTEHLDLERATDPAFRRSLAATLRLKYAGRRLDLIYTIEQPALDFQLAELAAIGPGAPVLLARAVLPERFDFAGRPFVRQLITYDLAGTLRLALALFPRTRKVLFVAGSSDSDRAVLAEARAALGPWSGQVAAEDTAGLSLAQVQARIAAPGADSVVVVLPFNHDATGQSTVQMEVALQVAAGAGAPVFTLWDNPVGAGAVGGSVTNFTEVGLQAAACALDLLSARTRLTAPVTDLQARPVAKFDWVQIRRWHGDAARLPAGSVVLNRPVTLWQHYRRTVIVTLLFLAGQTLMIVLLLVQRRLRGRAERELRVSEARFRHAIAEAPQPIMIHAEGGEVLALSRAWSELSGYSEAELPTIGDWVRLAYGRESETVARRISGHYQLASRKVIGEFEVTCRDGQTRIWDFSAVSLGALPDGRRIAMSIATDVTERKATELALRDALQFNEEIIRSAQEGVIVYGRDLRYRVWNPFMERLTGLGADRVLGRHPQELSPALADDQILPNLERALRGEEVEAYDLPFEHGEHSGWVSVRSSALRNSRGEIIGVIAMQRDITGQRQAERQQAALQTQLHQNQKMESLGNLAGGVAHDMNNILGAILSLASAHLAIQAEDGPVREAFQTITEAATRGGRMVKSLLAFARQHPAEERELDLNGILNQNLSLLARTALANVRLDVRLAPDLRPIRGDASALANAFMNLCVNAVDAMAADGLLSLRTGNVEPGLVEVTVTDRGHGMSPEVLARALDPFFTTKATGKGTGLGLSMVYSTVKAHHGTLELTSEPGRGTCVRMRFPAWVGPAEPGQPAPGPVPAAGGSLQVLLVDDDELVLKACRMLIELLGHTVRTANCGEAALAELEQGFPADVVILDLNMPGIGGAGTLGPLRALRPDLPVLLATGLADQDALDLLEAHSGVSLLAKPFGMVELQELLGQLAGH